MKFADFLLICFIIGGYVAWLLTTVLAAVFRYWKLFCWQIGLIILLSIGLCMPAVAERFVAGSVSAETGDLLFGLGLLGLMLLFGCIGPAVGWVSLGLLTWLRYRETKQK